MSGRPYKSVWSVKMKKHRDNDNSPLAEQGNEVEEFFSDLLTAVADDDVNRHINDKEAFDIYVQSIRSKLYDDLPLLKTRFSKGYQALLDDIKQN